MASVTKENGQKYLFLKFGGSDATDENGLKEHFVEAFFRAIGQDVLATYARVFIMVGGGPRARVEQLKVGERWKEKGLSEDQINLKKDKAGIRVTQQNAEEFKQKLLELGHEVEKKIPKSEQEAINLLLHSLSRIIVSGGYAPGETTDGAFMRGVRALLDNAQEIKIIRFMGENTAHTHNPRDKQIGHLARPIKVDSLEGMKQDAMHFDEGTTHKPGDAYLFDQTATQILDEIYKDSENPTVTAMFTSVRNIKDICTYIQNGLGTPEQLEVMIQHIDQATLVLREWKARTYYEQVARQG